MAIDRPILAKCKVCNNFAPSDQFKLHHTYKQMVCPNCFSGKTKKEEEKAAVMNMPKSSSSEAPKKAAPRPAGWDKEDEYLDKITRMRAATEPAMQFERIPGTDAYKCTCQKCKYQFRFDPLKQLPRTCPYCNLEVPRMKSFSLM